MVVDVGRFARGAGEALAPGTLWVVEQIPGLVVSADATGALARGYWASYNVPYFDEVRARTRVLSSSVRWASTASGETCGSDVDCRAYSRVRARSARRDSAVTEFA